MSLSRFLTCFPLIAVLIFSVSTENVIDDKQCGGIVELDNGSLEYYNNPDPIPGICIWTIHLQTMTGFKFRLRHLNLPGGGSTCAESSIGIYSLSNLLPGNIEGLKICNENKYDGDYIYNGNTLAIVLKIDPYTTGFNVGFIMDFEGTTVQPNPAKHSSSFTSAGSGVIQYPVDSEYEPNSVSTWVIQPQTLNEYTEIGVLDVDVESCSTPGTCLCDALILYAVTEQGAVEVADQYCGEKTNGNLTVMGNTFISVFYADLTDMPMFGTGFRMQWKSGPEMTTTPTTTTTTVPTTTIPTTTTPTTTPTTTTTTERTTTTEDPNPPTLTSCGGTFEGMYGRISYKLNEDYGNSERCAWIIRSPNASRYVDLKKVTDGFELGVDYIGAYAFDSDASESTTLGKTTHDQELRTLRGSVVVIVFTSSLTGTGQGFQLDFKFNETSTDSSIKVWNDYYSDDVSGLVTVGGREPGQHYENYEQSVFVMSRNNTYFPDIGWTAELLVYKVQESGIIIDPCYYDGIRVYSVAEDSLSFVGKFCSNSEKTFGPFLARNLYIFVFATDSYLNDGGFEISWELR